MTVHDFATSPNNDHADWWSAFYRANLRHYNGHEVVDDVSLQKAGIDHRVTTTGGAELLVDCKVRAKRWPDVLLEIWSDYEHRIPGWACKPLRCHYLAYVFTEDQTGLLIAFHLMQRALYTHWREWYALASASRNGFRWVPADNGTYTTWSLAIPTNVLLAAMGEASSFDMTTSAA